MRCSRRLTFLAPAVLASVAVTPVIASHASAIPGSGATIASTRQAAEAAPFRPRAYWRGYRAGYRQGTRDGRRDCDDFRGYGGPGSGSYARGWTNGYRDGFNERCG
jgi:hypothetical protein